MSETLEKSEHTTEVKRKAKKDRRPRTESRAAKIREMVRGGMTLSAVAKQLGIRYQAVYMACQALRKAGEL
jgi:DNA invertase Pin-like site-specific DNA recombinase